jgi:hypothetical protein
MCGEFSIYPSGSLVIRDEIFSFGKFAETQVPPRLFLISMKCRCLGIAAVSNLTPKYGRGFDVDNLDRSKAETKGI